MPRPNNAPTGSLEQIPSSKVKVIVGDLLQLHELGVCQTDAEVETRISQYFQLCRETSIRPGIESLAAALHVDRTTIWRWSQGQGCSRRRQDAINGARAMIAAFLEQVTMSGQINPIPALFLLKNWCAYRDVQTIEDARTNAPRPNLTPEEIQKRIEEDIPIDTDEDITAEVIDFRK